jgi:hypothetical protein
MRDCKTCTGEIERRYGRAPRGLFFDRDCCGECNRRTDARLKRRLRTDNIIQRCYDNDYCRTW